VSQLLGAVWLGFGIAFAAFPHQILQFFSRHRPITERSVSRMRTFGMFVVASAVALDVLPLIADDSLQDRIEGLFTTPEKRCRFNWSMQHHLS